MKNMEETASSHESSGTCSPRDEVSHGTHTASTAGGSLVTTASYHGIANGTAKGGCPSSRLAIYKVCSPGHGCPSSAIFSAFDDAIHDGVDTISVSLGSSYVDDEYFKDPTALGALHAAQEGITVIGSAGNGGPQPNTVVNAAPWIITVGASTTDRAFESNILLGNQDVVQGYGINIWNNLTHSKAYPLAFGMDVAESSSSLLEASWRESFLVDAQAAGIILVDDTINVDPSVHEPTFPITRVNSASGAQIIRYIMSTKNPKTTVLKSTDILQFKPAPTVVQLKTNCNLAFELDHALQPDITAPGTDILASVPPTDDQGDIVIGKPTEFRLLSGTSMSCPQVSGAAAFVKSKRPSWTPSIIRSSLMTTATTLNNQGNPITNHNEASASPHDMGAGQLNPSGAVNPGLNFNISRTITRILTNVGPKNSTYCEGIKSLTI
ncbi:hypothetical protein MKX01_001431, partial [Papaver californicum]